MTAIELPDPSLVVLVGAAGSGKSTFAGRHFAPDEILSSDAFRALVAGNERDQAATRAAFSILHRELERRLRAGRLVVIDATNVESHARRALVRRARAAGLPAIAIVLALPAAVVAARNAGRLERVVGQAIVDLHLGRLGAALVGDRLTAEGFADVRILRSAAEIDALTLERRLRPGRP